jgi:hypothetical protein
MDKTILNNKILYKLSFCGLALYSDYCITERLPQINQDFSLIDNLKDGDKIFIDFYTKFDYDIFLHKLENTNKKFNFFICIEPLIDKDKLLLLLKYSYHIFLQNNIYDIPNVHILPIGIRDCENIFPSHKGFNQIYLYNEKKEEREKKHLCLLCFTNHPYRNNCYNYLKDKDYVINLNKLNFRIPLNNLCGYVPIDINYQITHESCYTLCPIGNGIDTHRFFEAIYLNSIPIVVKTNTNFDKLYNIFPCILVDKWEDITKELLINNYNVYNLKLTEFNKKYNNFLTDLDSIYDLLLSL